MQGTAITGKTEVFQYDSATTTSNFIGQVTPQGYGYWSDNVWFDVDPTLAAHVCNKTILTYWGTIKGAYTYTTTSNGSVTIPEVTIVDLAVNSGGC